MCNLLADKLWQKVVWCVGVAYYLVRLGTSHSAVGRPPPTPGNKEFGGETLAPGNQRQTLLKLRKP